MTAYRGAYPHLLLTDQLADIPGWSYDLAGMLSVPLPVETQYASAGSDVPVSAGWSPISTLNRLDINATKPAEAPEGTRLLCLLGLKASIRHRGSGGNENIRLAPAILKDQSSYGNPPEPAPPFNNRFSQIEISPTSNYSSISDTWPVELSGRCSIRAMYTSTGVTSISYSRLSLVPLRWVGPT